MLHAHVLYLTPCPLEEPRSLPVYATCLWAENIRVLLIARERFLRVETMVEVEGQPECGHPGWRLSRSSSPPEQRLTRNGKAMELVGNLTASEPSNTKSKKNSEDQVRNSFVCRQLLPAAVPASLPFDFDARATVRLAELPAAIGSIRRRPVGHLHPRREHAPSVPPPPSSASISARAYSSTKSTDLYADFRPPA